MRGALSMRHDREERNYAALLVNLILSLKFPASAVKPTFICLF